MNAQKLKVLVLDDEPLIADSLAQVLNLFNCEATAIQEPEKAVEWLATNPCNIVVSDVVFNRQMSGIDLAIQLQKTLPNCKVLLMSGNNSAADLLATAQKQGYAFEIFAKPVHPSVILDRLKTFLPSAQRNRSSNRFWTIPGGPRHSSWSKKHARLLAHALSQIDHRSQVGYFNLSPVLRNNRRFSV